MRFFVPKEAKERMAMENARLLMQAQSNIGVLAGQIAAGAEGTKKQIEWYEQQQQQQQQTQPQPQPAPQPQPQFQPQQYSQHVYPQQMLYQPNYEQWQPAPRQQTYPLGVQDTMNSGRDESRAECIIS
jgi:hypothetical protein